MRAAGPRRRGKLPGRVATFFLFFYFFDFLEKNIFIFFILDVKVFTIFFLPNSFLILDATIFFQKFSIFSQNFLI